MTQQEYLKSVGRALVEENGKHKFYNQAQVEKAHQKIAGSDVFDSIASTADLLEMAWSLYSTAEEFVKATGSNTARYIELKAEALRAISETSLSDWYTLPDIDIDESWLDMGEILEGIGDFLGSVLGVFE